MSDPISSLLQRSLTGTSARGADASAKSGGTASVTKAGPATTNTTAAPATGAIPVDELDVAYLNEKADSIAKVLEKISDSVSTIRDTQGRLGQITSLLEQAGGIAVRARDTLKASPDADAVKSKLDELSTRFAKVLDEIDAVATKTDIVPNLLQGESLETGFDAAGTVSFETPGIFIGSKGLGLYPIAYAESTAEEADDVRAQVTNSLDQLKLFRQQLGSDLNTLQTRQDFSLNAMQILSTDSAVLPSSAEESANLLALQLRQQLAGSDVTLAGESARALLRQF